MESADIGYWASVPRGADHAELLDGKATASVKPFGDKPEELTGAKIVAGLKVMAEKFPHHYRNLIIDNADAETGDVLIQCALFGDIIFG